jgi:hypothetical protein
LKIHSRTNLSVRPRKSSALLKYRNRRLYSDLIIVALETSNKIGMRGRRPFGVTVGVMAAQTFTIFSETLVDFGVQANGWAVHAHVITICTSRPKTHAE